MSFNGRVSSGAVLVSACLLHSGGDHCDHLNQRTADHAYQGQHNLIAALSHWAVWYKGGNELDSFLSPLSTWSPWNHSCVLSLCCFSEQFFYAIANHKSSNIIVLCLAEVMVRTYNNIIIISWNLKYYIFLVNSFSFTKLQVVLKLI